MSAKKTRLRRRTVAGRAGTPDEVGNVGALLMGSDGGFVTGSDFLMDGRVTAAFCYGDLAEARAQRKMKLCRAGPAGPSYKG